VFKKTLEFKNAITIYYGRQKFVALQQRILKAQMWVIVEAIRYMWNLIVSTCVMNQSKGH
jgi:hypothetical protein